MLRTAQATVSIVLAVTLGVAACVSDSPPPPADTDSDYESVTVSAVKASAFDAANQVTGGQWDIAEDVDPCACETEECLEAWITSQFGCSVCVALVCDGEPGPHLCGPSCMSAAALGAGSPGSNPSHH